MECLNYCRNCEIKLNVDNAYVRKKDGKKYMNYCKKCHNARLAKNVREFKLRCVEHKGGKCEFCGYKKCIAALEFHHIDPSEKEFLIARAPKKGFSDIVKLELDKCLLLCSNCHREEHYRINLEKFIEFDKPYIKKQKEKGEPFIQKTKIDWPSLDELLEMLKESNFVKLGEVLGVSDNAIRNRLKVRGIDPKKAKY